jgi:hypothetical protein
LPDFKPLLKENENPSAVSTNFILKEFATLSGLVPTNSGARSLLPGRFIRLRPDVLPFEKRRDCILIPTGSDFTSLNGTDLGK